MPSTRSRLSSPALAVCFGAILWGVVWYPMRLLEAAGLHGIWLTLILYATALVAIAPFALRALAPLAWAPGGLAVLALAAGWTNIGFVQAVLEGNVLRVLLLFYLSPLWATVMGRLFLGERISPLAAASLGLASVGALVMLWNPALGAPWPEGRADWYALTAGFAFAASNVATRGVQDVPIATKLLCVFFGVTVMAGAIIGVFGLAQPAIAPTTAGAAMALGVFGILVMTWLIQYGVTNIPIYRSAVITFVELVAGAVSQALLTNEVVTLREWAGGALIVLGAYLSARSAGRTSPAPAPGGERVPP